MEDELKLHKKGREGRRTRCQDNAEERIKEERKKEKTANGCDDGQRRGEETETEGNAKAKENCQTEVCGVKGTKLG